MKKCFQFLKQFKKVILYKGYSVREYNKIRNCLDRNRIKYKQYVLDTASVHDMPSYMFFLTPVLYLAPRAFRGTGGIDGASLKTYVIMLKQKDMEKAKQKISENRG